MIYARTDWMYFTYNRRDIVCFNGYRRIENKL